jgi:hypothetical protein
MSNPNVVTVYSPEGEPFEMSRVNARDLCSHRGWSMSPLTVPPLKAEKPTEIKTETPVATKEETHAEDDREGSGKTDATGETEDGEGEGSEGSPGGEASEPEQEDVLTDTAIFTTEEQFAELTDREDVVAYLAKHFPDFRPHHKAGRDGLVAKAIELATSE